MNCKRIFGEKKPLEDKTETTGLCPECEKKFNEELDRLDAEEATK
jgi:hypothetical protein